MYSEFRRVHVISVYFILEHVLYFKTTCFLHHMINPDHSWSIVNRSKYQKFYRMFNHMFYFIFSSTFFERKISNLRKFFRAMAEMWKYSNFENNVWLNIFGKRIYIFGSTKWLSRNDPVIVGNDRSRRSLTFDDLYGHLREKKTLTI